MKMQRNCEGPKWSREDSKHKLGRQSNSHLGEYDLVRGVDRNGEAIFWCRVSRVFGLCAAKTGANIDESMRARENGH